MVVCLGSLIGKFVSPIVLGVIFFCVLRYRFLEVIQARRVTFKKLGSQTTSLESYERKEN